MKREITYKYAIVTPARDEQDFIIYTIESVISQTIRPLCWAIVNDCSTDNTKEIIESYSRKHDFIRLVNMKREGSRDFRRKVIAFNRGVREIEHLDYDFIGNLDADMLLAPKYYEQVLHNFSLDPKLGIAGGIVYSKGASHFYTADEMLHSVGGAVQLFRRTCFEDIEGYSQLKYGGEDAEAEIKARMLGWQVRKYPELKVFEQRRTGSNEGLPLRAKFREGQRFYSLGYWPLFFFLRCLYRLKDPPVITGSIAALYGFIQSFMASKPLVTSSNVVAYLKSEQRLRLKQQFEKLFAKRS